VQSKLYPAMLLDDSLETYLARFPGGRRPVYLGALLALLGALAALPLVSVPVTLQAPGIVRPVMEKNEVKVPVSGRVAAVLVRESQSVARGAPLVRLESSVLQDQDNTVRFRLEQLNAFTGDLERLTRAEPGAVPEGLSTPRYRQELDQLQGELAEVRLRERSAQTELDRAELMYSRELTSRAEVESRTQAVAEAQAAARVVWERYHARWQLELAQLRLEARGAESQRAGLAEQRALHDIASPMAGTVEELMSVAPGSYLQSGERLAVISPASALVAEMYVSPRDVGLIREGMPVRMHVDAFRYTDWGFVPGRVTEIADDFTLVNGVPVFRVRCSVERTHLALPNGASGQVKKGMTLRAHFVVTRRSLLSLLRGDVSDWIDPRGGGSARGEPLPAGAAAVEEP
jgi:multidrug efflux pump subunit AcrA (membrane-fusion protein)